jgi:hypothetical protein
VPTDDHTSVELQQLEHAVEFEGGGSRHQRYFHPRRHAAGAGRAVAYVPLVEIFIVQEGHPTYNIGSETIYAGRLFTKQPLCHLSYAGILPKGSGSTESWLLQAFYTGGVLGEGFAAAAAAE